MLGYGASGTLLTLLKEKIAAHFGAGTSLRRRHCHPDARGVPAGAAVPFNRSSCCGRDPAVSSCSPCIADDAAFFCALRASASCSPHFGGRRAHSMRGHPRRGGGQPGTHRLLFLVAPSQALSALTVMALLSAAWPCSNSEARPRCYGADLSPGAAGRAGAAAFRCSLPPYKDLRPGRGTSPGRAG